MRKKPRVAVVWRGGLVSLVMLALVCAAACRTATTPAPRAARTIADAGAPMMPEAARDAGSATAKPALHPRPMTSEVACSLAGSTMPPARAGAKVFQPKEAHCPPSDHFCDTVDVSPDPKDTCFVANRNIARAERESRAPSRAPFASSAWDKKSTPKLFERVDAHLHLDERETEVLHRNGFVVLDRLGYASYGVAYHDVFQQQLPVYIGVDAILNAVFQASQMLLEEVETKRLGPKLASMLDRMRATLRTSKPLYGGETAEDLDVYLTVAHRLFHTGDSGTPASSPAAESLVAPLVQEAESAGGLSEITIFGRARMIDFSQFTPRGHYASDSFGGGIKVKNEQIGLERYFRSMMWLSRFEWNLVSRDCRSSQPGETPDPSETPREARDALALADLARRAGALDDLRAFEEVYAVFGGRREDVSVPDLLALAQKNAIAPAAADAPARLRAAIGDNWQRKARIHFMPQGVTKLPAISTLFGARIAPDTAPLTRLVHDAIPDRFELGAPDVAYVLGHDRAKAFFPPGDAKRHPTLAGALDRSRAEMLADARGKSDVYSTWISAVARIAEKPNGAMPSYAKTDAYADFRMSSALAAYAQIRHTFVLLAGQGYDSYGCEIPDGYVEPAIGVYDGLLAWSRAARTAVPNRAPFFRRVDQVIGMLRAISETELSGAPLSEAQRRWLGMVAEYLPQGGYSDSGEPPKYTGWYFDLFPDREKGAERAVDLVADYFTLTNANQVRYLGIDKAALGVFVVDVGGEPRAMVGPVVKPYETVTEIASRLDDKRGQQLPAANKRAPWTSSYLVAEKPAPSLAATFFSCPKDDRVVVESDGPLGDISVTLLDHHGDAITQPQKRRVDGTDAVVFSFVAPADAKGAPVGVEGLHVRVHDLGGGRGRWDGIGGGSVYDHADAIAGARATYGVSLLSGAMRPAAD